MILNMIAELQYFKIFPHYKTDFVMGYDIIVYGRVAADENSELSSAQPIGMSRVLTWQTLSFIPPDPSAGYDMGRYQCPLTFEACIPAIYEAVDSGKEVEEARTYIVDLCRKFMADHCKAWAKAISDLREYCDRNDDIAQGKDVKPFKMQSHYC